MTGKSNTQPTVRKEQVVTQNGDVETKFHVFIPEYGQEVIIMDQHINTIMNQINKLKNQSA